MKRKLILITGSTDGIGKETAIKLLEQGHHVIVHGRSLEKVNNTIKSITKKPTSNSIDGVYGDLGSFRQIKEMIKMIYNRYDHIDNLINNAGVLRQNRYLTPEGLEETFAINYLAPFLLTNLLLDLIKKSNYGRIINVVSQVHSNHLNWNNLQLEKDYTGVKAYAQSKTCLIMFTYLLSEKLKTSKITVNCLHPGIIDTKVLKAGMGSIGIGAPVSEGANSLIYLALAPQLEKISGKYFNQNKIEPSKEITYDKQLQKKLWELTEDITGTKFSSN